VRMMASDTCHVCGSDLVEYEFLREDVLLHGPLLACSKCVVLYFRPGYSFISPDGNIALHGTEGDPYTSLFQRMREPGFKVVRTDIEHHVISVLPGIEEISVSIGSRRLNEVSSRIVREVASLVRSVRRKNAQQAMDLQFLGLLGDPRPIWGIPEVATWCFDTWRSMPDLACHLTPDSLFPFSRAACFGFREDHIDRVLQERPDLNIDEVLRGGKDVVRGYRKRLNLVDKKFLSLKDGATRTAAQRLLIFTDQSIMALGRWRDALPDAEASDLQSWNIETIRRFDLMFLDVLPTLAGKAG